MQNLNVIVWTEGVSVLWLGDWAVTHFLLLDLLIDWYTGSEFPGSSEIGLGLL